MTSEIKRLAAIRRAALRAEMMRLAARPDGTATGDYERRLDAQGCADKLVEEGKLFKVKFSHRTIRYYASKRTADMLRQIPNSQHVTLKPRQSAGWPPDMEAEITPNTKFTICPSPAATTSHRKQISNW